MSAERDDLERIVVETLGSHRHCFVVDAILAAGYRKRDPAEPTIAEIREKVRALDKTMIHSFFARAGDPSTGPYARTWTVALDAVLALLEPKKPKPTYKPGDFVTFASVASPAPVERIYVVVAVSGYLVEAHRVGGGDVWQFSTAVAQLSARPATDAEIEQARA